MITSKVRITSKLSLASKMRIVDKMNLLSGGGHHSNGSKKNLPRVLTRYGGKGNLMGKYMPYIKMIAEQASCDTFIDLFGGGASATFASMTIRDQFTNRQFKRIIYNELELSVAKTFEVVKDKEKCPDLIRRLIKTPYSREAFDVATAYLNHLNTTGNGGDNDVMIAWAEIVNNRLSYNGAGKNFRDFRKYNCKNKYIDYEESFRRSSRRLTKANEALQDVEIRQGDYSVTLDEFKNDPKAFFFIDPPYLDVERAKNAENVYRHEFTKDDHMKLLQRLSECQHWMLCGYRGIAEPDGKGKCRDTGKASEIYDFIESIPGVQRIDLGLVWKPSSGKKRSESGSHEFIWVRA